MTDDLVREAERAFERHGAFEADGDAFVVTTSPFDASVRVADAGGVVAYRVTVRVPTINAVVRGEEVAPVVREGWFETFERRMEDVGGATRADPSPPVVSLAEGEVVVESGFETDAPEQGVEDAKAIVDYVEGTYLAGIIPGYEYRDPVEGMIDRAGERSGSAGGPPL